MSRQYSKLCLSANSIYAAGREACSNEFYDYNWHLINSSGYAKGLYKFNIMRNIKILLLDPRHVTRGLHSNFVPINIGYIGEFLKNEIKNINLELEITTEPEEIFRLLRNWRPDIVGVSNYVWNSTLSNLICKYSKKLNSNILCIMGGPEFPAGTGARKIENTSNDQTYDKCLKYLIDRPSVDYFAYCDGEVVFLEKELLSWIIKT